MQQSRRAVPRLRRRNERHGRDGQNDARLRIDRAQLRDEARHVGDDILDAEVQKFVPPLVEGAAEHPGTHWKHRAVLARAPAFGQAQCKHENIEILEHLPHVLKMTFMIGPIFPCRAKIFRLNIGAEGIDDLCRAFGPHVLFRREASEGAAQ